MRPLLGALLIAAVAAHGNERPEPRDSTLRLELVRESLTGTHYRYRRVVDGTPLLDEYVVSRTPLPASRGGAVQPGGEWFAVREGGAIRRVRETVTTDGLARPIARYVEETSGTVLFERPIYFDAKPARVFDPNPVVTLNDPTLQDRNDAAAAVPVGAYRTVAVEAPAGPHATIVDLQLPAVPPVDPAGALLFDRSQSGFEDVNALFHIDRSQRHLQSLGYAGGRQIVPYAIPVDTHATGGADTSYFVPTAGDPGRGTLFFGVGGTDDAEDADLVVHEYGHAILEWIAPGTFAGAYNGQARALAEAVTDYWAFSAHYALRRASGRDAFCFADWDTRCWEDDASQNCGYAAGTDCLRRLDVRRTMAEYQAADTAGTEHWNGQIFGGALVELFLQNAERYGVEEGRRITDTLVIEALFETPAAPGFVTVARQLMNADRLLFGGVHAEAICTAMSSRGIPAACEALPRGDVTHYQSTAHGVAIPDGDPRGIEVPLTITDPRRIEDAYVRVDISHPSRGDLRIELIAPDDTVVLLQRPSLDAAHHVRTTFGRDAIPEESLGVLRGKSAAGTWRLRVADTRGVDAGTLDSWALILRFEGSAPLVERPSEAGAQVIAVVTHVSGVNATQFRSELRMLNTRGAAERVTLVFTPSGKDGRVEFAAVDVVAGAGQLVVLDDIVRSVFGIAGSGTLRVIGDVAVTSRTYTPDAGGTAGQAIAPGVAATRATLFHVSIDRLWRTNVGFADASGRGAVVRLTVRDDVGLPPLSESFVRVLPFGHQQVPLQLPAGATAEDLVVEIEATAPVYSYASVVSNVSGDAMFVTDEESRALPAIMAAGANGTTWRTDLVVVRHAPEPPRGTFPLAYVDADSGDITSITLRTGPPGMAWVSDDVVRDLGRPGTRGVVFVPDGLGVGLRARIYNGAFSASVPALRPFEGPAHLVHVESTDGYRTNIGLFSDAGAAARVVLRDANGAFVEERIVELPPMRLVQFPVGRRLPGGYAEVLPLRGAVRAYSSVVDNRSGDASIVAAR